MPYMRYNRRSYAPRRSYGPKRPYRRKTTTASKAASIVRRAPPYQRAKAVKSIQRATRSVFNRKVSSVINKTAETYHQYARALYAPPQTATNFQNGSYHLFNLTGSAPLDGQSMAPQQLMGLIPSDYGAGSPNTFLQGGFIGSSVFGKNTFSTIKITMPVLQPDEISSVIGGNQSQYYAQNWNIRVLIFKTKPFPSTSS